MSQAKRIKPKASKSKKKVVQPRRRFALPWGLVCIILVTGVLLGMLIQGSVRQHEGGLGSGLRVFFAESEDSETVSDAEIEALIKDKSIENGNAAQDFAFYEVLPDIEQIMPKDIPQKKVKRNNVNYFLQAASFTVHADAEKLRAKLALKGYSSVTQSRKVEGKGVYYRVRLGPYADKRKAKNVKNKLQKLGVRPFIYTVKRS